MSAVAEPDTDILGDLDFEYVPKCETGRVRCPEPATHRAVFSCDCVILYCARHALERSEEQASKKYMLAPFWCCKCKAPGCHLVSIWPIS